MKLLLPILLILVSVYDGFTQKSSYIDSILSAIEQGNYTLTNFPPKPNNNARRGNINKLIATSSYIASDSSHWIFNDSSRYVYSGNRTSVFPDNSECDTLQRFGALQGLILNNSLIIIRHDTISNAVRDLTYRWIDNQWKLTDSITLVKNGVYDTVRVYSTMNDSIVPQRRWIYLIDNINNMYFECPATYENNDWKNIYLEFSALNSNKQPLLFIRLQSYQNNSLDSLQIIHFSYNAQNLLNRITNIAFDTLGNRSSIVTTDYFYDTANVYIGSVSVINQNGNTSYRNKEQVTTDSTGLKKQIEKYTFANNSWILNSYTLYVRDTVERIDTVTYYEKEVIVLPPNHVQFQIKNRTIEGYDEKGRITKSITQVGKILKNSDLMLTVYSNTNKILERRYYIWQNQSWIPNSVEKNSFNTEDLITSNIYGNYSNSSWKETKYYYETGNASKIEEIKHPYNLSFFPNPANTFLTVSLKEYAPDIMLTVLDVTGKKIHSQPMYLEAGIDISSWSAGVYFVRVESKEKLIGVSKLMKE